MLVFHIPAAIVTSFIFAIFFNLHLDFGDDPNWRTCAYFFKLLGKKTDRGAQLFSFHFFRAGHQDAWEDAGAEERCSIKTSRKHGSHGCEEGSLCSGGLVIFSTCFVFSPRSKQIKRLILLIKELWPKPLEGTVLVVYLPLFKDGFSCNIPAR